MPLMVNPSSSILIPPIILHQDHLLQANPLPYLPYYQSFDDKKEFKRNLGTTRAPPNPHRIGPPFSFFEQPAGISIQAGKKGRSPAVRWMRPKGTKIGTTTTIQQ